MAEFKAIWRGNIISMIEEFGTDRCKLCMKEHTEIIGCMYLSQGELINCNFEIYEKPEDTKIVSIGIGKTKSHKGVVAMA